MACGLPMWRESSFVGPNIVSAQTIWDGLWYHCVVQSTGQMQCKKPSGINHTTDLQAGRALTLLSIIVGLIGFIIAVLGGGVANCSGAPPPSDNYYSARQSTDSTTSSQNKASLLGGILCVIAGILCLVAVIWSAALTTLVRNDVLVVTAMKRDVGTSVYVGLVSGLLLLVGGAVICMVCTAKPDPPPQVSRPYLPTPYSYAPPSPLSMHSQPRSDIVRSYPVFSPVSRTPQYQARPYDRPPETRPARESFQYRAASVDPRSAYYPRTQPKQELFGRDTPSTSTLLPREYFHNTPN